jgi:hypothetical protein
MVILPILPLALFCKKSPICRAVSTSVERLGGKAMSFGVAGVGEDLGFGRYDKGLLLGD